MLSITTKKRCRLSKRDTRTEFLLTGDAERDVLFIPPVESDDRGSYLWLLLAAEYGLINPNDK